jgi:acetolactate synthase small subunit
LISAFAVAHKIPLMVKVDCSGIVSRVAGLFHRRGFKGAY